MNLHQKPLQRRPQNPAYRQAFERLDETLAENTQSDNFEKIRLMRRGMFADVDRLQESGTVVIPK